MIFDSRLDGRCRSARAARIKGADAPEVHVNRLEGGAVQCLLAGGDGVGGVMIGLGQIGLLMSVQEATLEPGTLARVQCDVDGTWQVGGTCASSQTLVVAGGGA